MTPSSQILVEIFRATVSGFWTAVHEGKDKSVLAATTQFMHAALRDINKEVEDLPQWEAEDLMDQKNQVHRHMLTFEKGPNSQYGYNGPYIY